VIAPEILLHPGANAAWYQDLSRRGQRKTVSRLEHLVSHASEFLLGRIDLPSRICIGFSSEKNCFAIATDRSIRITQSMKRLMEDRANYAMCLGIIGHEISHLSDYKTGNDAGKHGLIRTMIAEGKADLIGMILGGERYANELCDILDDEEKAEPYRMIGLGITKDKEMGLKLARYGAPAAANIVGLSLVLDTIVHRDEPNIYAIHGEPVSYFREAAMELAEHYETAT